MELLALPIVAVLALLIADAAMGGDDCDDDSLGLEGSALILAVYAALGCAAVGAGLLANRAAQALRRRRT